MSGMTKEKGMIISGKADKPIYMDEQDDFEMNPYVAGLGDFTLECQTPLTIAVQGDWGSGKTSIMYLLQNYLKNTGKVETIWFNTWQFSQFKMDAHISITFLQHLIKEFEKKIERTSVHVDELGKKLLDFTKGIATGFISDKLGEDAANKAKEIVGMEKKQDMVDVLIELKENFQKLVDAVTEGDKRVVIFVDDLDRLQPIHAIELLEVLKNFVDCENCIFVLAIDTSVVFQGIREKYGDISQEKAQNFFDKMIQLPFNMPIANYKLENMISKVFGFDLDNMNSVEKKEYIELIKMTSDSNPRSIKRIANFYMLTNKVAKQKNIYAGMSEQELQISEKILFAFACIELKYPIFYNYILNHISIEMVTNLDNMGLPGRDDKVPYNNLSQTLAKLNIPAFKGDDIACDKYARVIIIFILNCKKLINMGDAYVQKKKLVSMLSLSELSDAGDANNNVMHADIMEAKQDDIGQSGERIVNIEDIVSRKIADGKVYEAYCELWKRGIYPIIPASFLDIAIGDSKDSMNDWINKSKDYNSYPWTANIEEDLSGTYTIEIKTNSIYLLKGDIRYFNLSVDGAGGIGTRGGVYWVSVLNRYISGKSSVLEKLRDMVEKERILYESLSDKYGRVLFPPELFGNKVSAKFEGDVLVGFTQKGGGDMQLPLMSREMYSCFANFALDVADSLNENTDKKAYDPYAAKGLEALLRAAENADPNK